MEALFKKYFWVVNLTVLTAVAWLTAKTAVDYLAAQYLTIDESEVEVTAAADDVELLQKVKGEALAETLTDRTPFNLDPKEKPNGKTSTDPDCKTSCEGKSCGDDGCGGTCGECADDESCNEGKCEAKDDGPQESELNVELIGTITSPTNPNARFANIKADGSIEMVSVGSDILDGKATVIDIQSRIIYLKEGSKLTHVMLWSETTKKASKTRNGKKSGRVSSSRQNLKRPDPSKSVAAKKQSSSRPAKFDYSSGVKKNGEYDYTIDKQMLDEQLTDLTQLGMQARVIPNYRKGKYEGFKLVGVRPGSLYRAIGIRSGDIVRSINGEAINSPNKAMELFNKLKNSSSLNLEVERRGKIEQFNYSIR